MERAELIVGLEAVSRPQLSGAVRLSLKSLVWLAGLAYFLTSAVVIINAFVWLPGMPSAWYQLQRVLYWPFQPYFSMALQVMGNPSISYPVYATVSRSPFILLPMALAVVWLRRRGGGKNNRGKGDGAV